MRPKVLVILVVFAAALAGASEAARAQEGGLPPPPYQSPMRGECEAELAKDPVWSGELETRVRGKIHGSVTKEMLTNNRHVVMAYAALWILTALFLGFMWLRQQRLTGEIARLEKELERAIADDSAPAGGK